MQRGEDLVGILTGALLALRAGTEPEPRGLDLQPRSATPPSVTEAVHERTLDREDALLPAWCRRRNTPRLSEERVVQTAKVDLDGWYLHVEILTQTAERDSRSSSRLA
jgi:hypothetical protein